MDLDKIMEGKKEKKTEYMVNLKMVGALWTLMLFLKVLCQDEEWGSFLMFTALLLLFILTFFNTKEVVRDVKFAGVELKFLVAPDISGSCPEDFPVNFRDFTVHHDYLPCFEGGPQARIRRRGRHGKSFRSITLM